MKGRRDELTQPSGGSVMKKGAAPAGGPCIAHVPGYCGRTSLTIFFLPSWISKM